MLTKKKDRVISLPVSVFGSAETKDDLEDWLLSQDPKFIKKMKRARKDNIEGKEKDWEQLTNEAN
ncbi:MULTISPECIES: hypothetical protein [Thermodesulfovibrio]|jgi:hypothetical protein|uniref:hypothetical protein n=1 Tax=Thermodesulfovibrio TaxID=28261 RepID=UPI002623EEDC|nr:hypothetical protein [Thermodesulfovibrio sp.]